MDMEFVAAFNGGLWSGIAVWAVSAAVVGLIAVVRKRRARWREVISLMNRAHAVAFSAIDERLYEDAWVEDSALPLRDAKARYDELTAQALNLFEPAEADVAFWCAVELYAGWRSPLHGLAEAGLPRERNADGTVLLDNGSMWQPYELPRVKMLADWANVVWPWDTGSARGPAYATLATPGDRGRHNIVPPNSDVNGDMLLAYANLIRPPEFDATGRRARELRKMFPHELEGAEG